MKTYINKHIGFYEVDSELSDNFSKGETEFDYQNGAFVLLDESQLNFKQDNPDASPLEVFKKTLNILELKNKKLQELELYDKSESVNCFFINGEKMWIDRDTRTSLLITADILKDTGDTHITLWSEGINPKSFNVPVDIFIQMLKLIEIYAKTCYNVTSTHKYNINQLTTAEDVINYDFTKDYPDYKRLIL